MKKKTIIFLEICMLLGIVLSALTVPRNTPLLTFGIISGIAFVLGNILIFRRIKQARTNSRPPVAPTAQETRRRTWAALLAVLFWIILFLLRSR